MLLLENKSVLVIGLGPRGRAACEFLRRSGAQVLAVDSRDNAELRAAADELVRSGFEVALGVTTVPERDFSLVVVSPAVKPDSELVKGAVRRNV
jgi:UDP-N-acetylmuramoylalanine-D-glutamate ligase